MSRQFDDALAAAAPLNRNDLLKLQQWVKDQLAGMGADESSRAVSEVYAALSDVWPAVPPMPMFSRMTTFAKFKKVHVPALVPYVSENFSPRTSAHRAAAYRTCFEALLLFMKRRDVPVSATSITNCMPHISAAVEEQFPGYAAAGMLPLILNSRKQ